MAIPIQTIYRRYQQEGWPGQFSKPSTPTECVLGPLHVPAGGSNPRPGYGVLYDAAEDAFRLPANAAERTLVMGMIIFESGTVGSVASSRIGANSDVFVEYEDGDYVKIAILGTAYAIAGEGLEFGDAVVFDESEGKWNILASVATPIVTEITDVSPDPDVAHVDGGVIAAGDLVQVDTVQSVASLSRNPAIVVSPKAISADGLVEIRFSGPTR